MRPFNTPKNIIKNNRDKRINQAGISLQFG